MVSLKPRRTSLNPTSRSTSTPSSQASSLPLPQLMATLLLRVSASTKGCNIGILFGAESVGFYQYGDGFRQGALFYNPDAKGLH